MNATTQAPQRQSNYWLAPMTKMEEAEENLNPKAIVDIVCKTLELPKEDVKYGRRTGPLSEARQICYLMLRRYTSLTYKEIGKIFNKDHSTIMHGIETIHNLIVTEKQVKKLVEQIDQTIQIRYF